MGVEQITNSRMKSETINTEEGEIETYSILLEFERSGEICIPLEDTSSFHVRKLAERLRGETADPEDIRDIIEDYLGLVQGLPF